MRFYYLLSSSCQWLTLQVIHSFKRDLEGRSSLSFSFTIVVEALSSFLVKVRELGIISGFKIGRCKEVITHLQFADDTILFSSAKREEILAIKRILQCFQLVPGLKINISKNLLVGVGCYEETTQALASNLSVGMGGFPSFILGCLLVLSQDLSHFGIQ